MTIKQGEFRVNKLTVAVIVGFSVFVLGMVSDILAKKLKLEYPLTPFVVAVMALIIYYLSKVTKK
jgi:uncharacterized membrane protein